MNGLHSASRFQRRGFTIMHMMIALPLLSVFMILGSKLFITNNQLLQTSTTVQGQLVRTDLALHQVRLDAWSSTSAVVETDKLVLTQPFGEVQWRIDEDGGLSRSVAGLENEARQFADIEASGFESRHGAVFIVVNDERYLCPLSLQASNDLLDRKE